MDIRKKNPGLVRSVGVMAGGAVRFRNRVIHVLPGKDRAIRFMTVCAEGDQIAFQKVIRFGRCMGFMAVNASPFYGAMFEFHFGNGIADVLMTLDTESISWFKENKLIVGCVGIVAFNTIAFPHHVMNALWIFRQNSVMTLHADPVGVFVKELPMGRGMGVMALRAVPFFNRSMDKRTLQFVFKTLMTIQAKLPFGLRFQLKFVLSISQ
jgi:hypothetical protein